MNKLAFVLAFVFFAVLASVSAVPGVDITGVTTSPTSVAAGSSFTVTVAFTNTGTDPLMDDAPMGYSFYQTSYTSGPNSFASPIITDHAPVAAGNSSTHTFTVTVPIGTPAGTYATALTLEDAWAAVWETQSYAITIAPVLPGVFSATPSPLSFILEEGSDADATFTLTNTGGSAITSIALSSAATLTDEDDNVIQVTVSPTTISSLAASATSSAVTVSVDVENGYAVGIVSTNVTVTGTTTSGAISLVIPLTIDVRPLACEEGEIGDLDLTIEEPDNDQDFQQGETVLIEVEVQNDGDDDLDVRVQAVLWNIDEDEAVGSATSDAQQIDEDDEETFTFDLVIDGDIDEDDTYTLYFKAYEVGNEEDHCLTDDLDVEIEEQNLLLRIKNVALTPSVVSCGSNAQLALTVENTGQEDAEDVLVRVVNAALGLNAQSDAFDLDNDRQAVVRVPLAIDQDVDAGSYPIDITVDYGLFATQTATLQVTCAAQPTVSPSGNQPTVTVPVSQPVTSPATTVAFKNKSFLDDLEIGQIPAWIWLVTNVILAAVIGLLAVVAISRRRH